MALLPITLRQLEYLCAVADTLNFKSAAARCHVSQPTISAAIQSLEQQLGMSLFERDKRHVALTAEGQAVVAHAHKVVTRARDIVDLASSRADMQTGQLTLAAIPTIAPFCLGPLLENARAHFPKLRITLREMQTRNLIEGIDRGEIDLGLLALPADTGRLVARPIASDALRLIAHRNHPAQTGTCVSLGSLRSDELVWLEEGHCLRDHGLAACGLDREVPEVLAVNSLLTMVQLVAAGHGAALVPQLALDAGIVGDLPIDTIDIFETPERQLAWVCRKAHPKIAFLLGDFADDMDQVLRR